MAFLNIPEKDRQINKINYPGVKSKTDLVDKLYRDKKFISLLKLKMTHNYDNFKEDVVNDLMLYLLKIDEKKLLDMNKKGQLHYFLLGMLWRQIKSSTSFSYIQYIKRNTAMAEEHRFKNDIYEEYPEEEIKFKADVIKFKKKCLEKAINQWKEESKTNIEKAIFLDIFLNKRTNSWKKQKNYGLEHTAKKFGTYKKRVSKILKEYREEFNQLVHNIAKQYEKNNPITN